MADVTLAEAAKMMQLAAEARHLANALRRQAHVPRAVVERARALAKDVTELDVQLTALAKVHR